MYQCKECGAPAAVDERGNLARSCEHTGTVVMALDVVLRGKGRLDDGDPAERLVAFFQRIGHGVMRRVRGDGRVQ